MKRTLLITFMAIACLGGLYIFLTWNNNGNPRFMHHRYNKVVTLPLAKIGFSDAQYKMGLFYIEGAINPPSEEYDAKADLENAIYWWEKASSKGNEKATAELAKAKEKLRLEKTNNPIESEQISFESTPNHKSLNDIRFGDWTDEDWYDNDYFRFLRQTFDDCLANKVELEQLNPYKSLLSSKFVIFDSNPFLTGGLLIDLVFIDAPEKVFSAHIYSDVNEASETVTDYRILGFKLNDGDSGFTKDRILELVQEHPENKLW